MSWSISYTGKPEQVIEELRRYGTTLVGQSLVEYEASMPSLLTIVGQNFATDASGYAQPTIELSACGSGCTIGGVQASRTCQVNINCR